MEWDTLEMDSPLGILRLVGSNDAVVEVTFAVEPHRADAADSARRRTSVREGAPIDEARRQLEAYFAGRLKAFDLPLSPHGTPFQRTVWEALRTIPFGVTWSYGELARVVGRPGASRAVGAANGANPLAVVIPCHRVIGADGRLTGYAGGEAAKRWLLEHEARVAGRPGQGMLL